MGVEAAAAGIIGKGEQSVVIDIGDSVWADWENASKPATSTSASRLACAKGCWLGPGLPDSEARSDRSAESKSVKGDDDGSTASWKSESETAAS